MLQISPYHWPVTELKDLEIFFDFYTNFYLSTLIVQYHQHLLIELQPYWQVCDLYAVVDTERK